MNHSRSMVDGHIAANGTVHQEVLWSLTTRQAAATLQDQVCFAPPHWHPRCHSAMLLIP